MSLSTEELVELGDLDALVRHIDALCERRDWEGLLDLRDRCEAALRRGRQLWPVAAHAEYRLALEAPARWAGRVLVPGTGRFALGPLPEVAAATHTWVELAPHVPTGPVAGITAHERVVRGDDLRDDAPPDAAVLELPLVLQPWEPVYPLAEYHADRAEFPTPPLPRLEPVRLPASPTAVDDPDARRALTDLAAAWVSESNGRSEAACAEGDAAAAVALLGPPRARMGRLSPAAALAWMAWVGASGGGHGRRKGMAAGRFGAWWALAGVAGLLDDWPVAPDELGEAAAELRWYAWDAGEPATGWSLHLAVDDPAEGLAWAVAAVDQRFTR